MFLFQIFLKDEFDHLGINQDKERVSNLRQQTPKDQKSNDANQMTAAETIGLKSKKSPTKIKMNAFKEVKSPDKNPFETA